MTVKVTEGIFTYGPDGKEIKSKSNEQESQNIIDENKLVNNQQNEGSVEKESKDTEQSIEINPIFVKQSVRNNPAFVSQLIDDNSTFSRINTELYKSKQQDTTPDNDLSTDPYIPNSSSNELERIENEVCNDIQGNNKQSSNSIEGKQLQMGGINPQNPNGYASIPQMQPSIPQPQYGDNTPIRMPQPVPYTTNEGNTPIQMPIQPTPQMQPSIPQPQYGDNTPIQMPQQESYTTNEGNTPIQPTLQMQPSIPQPQYGDNTPIRMPKPVPYTTNEGNTPTQMQNQPIVQYSQQPFTSKSEISKEEINYNYYAPRVYDDEAGCVTFIKKVKDNIKSGVSLVNYDKVLQHLRNTDRADNVELGNIYISEVKKYGCKYSVKIQYINSGRSKEKTTIVFDKKDCVNNKIVPIMKQEGIQCFNTDYSDKKISEYLYKLMLSKIDDEQYDLPEGSGFNWLNDNIEFVSYEMCQKKEIPVVTENEFEVSVPSDISYDDMMDVFIISLKEQKSPEKFLLLNMIRVGGLLSHPLAWCNTYFSKLIFINGDCDELSKYLQIYNREDGRNNTVSINQKKECLKDVVSGFRDDVPVFYDEKNASTYRKNTGKDTIEWLSRENKAGEFIAVVFSDRLSQLVESKRAFVIDYSDYNPVINLRDGHIKLMTYCLDNKIIERVCSEFDDFKKCVNSKIDTYYESAANQNVDRDTFTYFMLVYNEIVRQYQEIKTIVTPEKMESFLIELLKKSDATYNGGSISEEFKTKLNQMFIDGKLELVENSKINRCFGSSGLAPKVFNDEDWLYFTAETFEFVTSQITLANNPNVLRKALLEKSLLKVSECMTYKATLYDSQYSGKVNVTAVSIGVLSEEARRLQKGGMFNYNPCSDEGRIDRICIGQDEKGRNVYWSIGHEYMSNSHLMVNGVSGAGKTTAVNLIVKELFRKKKKVIYVDFTQSATDKRLEQTGIDKEFISKNIMRNNINDVVNNPDELEAALSLLSEQDIILLFETSKYDESVESFLGMLYDRMADGYTDSIYLVIDEIHELNYSKGSPLYNIMEKGRGKDVALIGIFQGAHETKPKQYSMLNQADMKLIFRLNDRKDAETVAESNGLKPLGEFADRILKLKKRKCLVVGNLEDDEGNLESRRFIEVEIANAY